MSALGDLTCWGVDVAAWQQAHRLPLFDGQFNTWLVQVVGASSAFDATDKALALVRSIAGVSGAKGSVVGGDDGADGAPVAQSVTDAADMTWAAGSASLVRLEFVYNGPETSVSWPLSDGSRIVSAYCPKSVVAAVVSVYAGKSLTGPAAPPPPPAPTVGGFAAALMPLWAWGAVGAVAGFFITRKMSRR